ncbi:MAG: hypothetical protein L0170_05305 [Acidobacteria bacterium]|nr:hypothetical protein [Acidobacteriota bacterium]
MVIKRVGVMSFARIFGILYAFLGLIAGAAFSLIAVFLGALGAQNQSVNGPLLGVLFGAGAVIALPIFYGAVGFGAGALSAALYNWISGFVGGIQLEME